MIKIICNNVDNYPILMEIENKVELIEYFSNYYDNPLDLADELLSDGFLSINDGSSTYYEVV